MGNEPSLSQPENASGWGSLALQLHVPFVMIRAREWSLGFFQTSVTTLATGRRRNDSYDVRYCTIPLARAQD